MKKIAVITLSAIILSLFAGCASIVSKSDWPVSITSQPNGASVVVKNSQGMAVFSGITPTSVTLSSKKAYLQGESYTLEFYKDGFNPVTYKLNPSINEWYIGNLVFGGLIGILIVDPMTGAMYKLDESVNVSLSTEYGFSQEEGALNIVSLNNLPEELKSSIVEVAI